MELYRSDPFADGRWDELVARHPDASVFHTRGWLEALVRTYGYTPFVLTSAPTGNTLKDGVVFCRVASWLTGTRAVSLPFADHCEPLLENSADVFEFTHYLREECDRKKWNYAELRPLTLSAPPNSGFQNKQSYCFHTLDLSPSLEKIFESLHKDSMQRRIRHAEKEGLTYEAGSSELLDDFYKLLLITRRRHGLIPQPRAWFQNLMECMRDGSRIRLVRKNRKPVAAILTLRHKSTLVYKYGCSDHRFHSYAGMPLLFWKLIEEGKATGAGSVDFGRSDPDGKGLIAFKDRLAGDKRSLSYWRYSRTHKPEVTSRSGARVLSRVFCQSPDAVLAAAGNVFYRHLG